MSETHVILKYQRQRPCWKCAACETENNFETAMCAICGEARSNISEIVDVWRPENEWNNSAGFGGGAYNNSSQIPTYPDQGLSGVSAESSKSNAGGIALIIILFAIIVFVFIVIMANI